MIGNVWDGQRIGIRSGRFALGRPFSRPVLGNVSSAADLAAPRELLRGMPRGRELSS
jgi:hypothetical protein